MGAQGQTYCNFFSDVEFLATKTKRVWSIFNDLAKDSAHIIAAGICGEEMGCTRGRET